MTRAIDKKKLRYGWTTGATATAATKAALKHLLSQQDIPSTVTITLPQGQTPVFQIAQSSFDAQWTEVGIIKDAGDDPDVTHGALILSKVSLGIKDSGIVFQAGSGVGIVTRAGLPLGVGEPAINPMPRQMMRAVISALCEDNDVSPDIIVTLSVPNGEKIAKQTLNGRLGILGGISILGTTGIVVPYSCSAWIHSIHRGIDVAKAANAHHIAACVGSTSERMIQRLYPHLGEELYIDMGDFVGGTLKYFRKVPIPKITVSGGFGKFSKLAHGARDLHSKRSTVDIAWLAAQLELLGASHTLIESAKKANTALEILQLSQQHKIALGDHIAKLAQAQCHKILRHDDISVEIIICDREAKSVGHAPF